MPHDLPPPPARSPLSPGFLSVDWMETLAAFWLPGSVLYSTAAVGRDLSKGRSSHGGRGRDTQCCRPAAAATHTHTMSSVHRRRFLSFLPKEVLQRAETLVSVSLTFVFAGPPKSFLFLYSWPQRFSHPAAGRKTRWDISQSLRLRCHGDDRMTGFMSPSLLTAVNHRWVQQRWEGALCPSDEV